MAKTFENYISKIRMLAKDNSELLSDPADYQDSLEDAVDTYSDHKPLNKVYPISSTGVRVYGLPTDFDNEISTLKVEYPVSSTEEQLTFLNSDNIEVYNDNGTNKLRFVSTPHSDPVPPSGEAFRLHYTTRHSVPQSGTITVPESHFKAVCYEAASLICQKMSQRMAQNGSADLTGGGSNYGNRTDKLLELSKEFHQKFLDKIAPAEDETAPAASFGRFVTNDYNRRPRGLFPRSSSGILDVE